MLTTATEDLLLDGLAGSLSRVVPLSFERAAQNRLENYLHLDAATKRHRYPARPSCDLALAIRIQI